MLVQRVKHEMKKGTPTTTDDAKEKSEGGELTKKKT